MNEHPKTLLDALASESNASISQNCVSIRFDGTPEFCVEALPDGPLAAHADLGPLPSPGDERDELEVLEHLLQANGPDAAVMQAIDPVTGAWSPFLRIEGASASDYAPMVQALYAFGSQLNEPLAAHPALSQPEPVSASDLSRFEHLCSEYAHVRGLTFAAGAEADANGYCLAPDEGGLITVRPEAGGTVLLRALLAFTPLDVDNDEHVYRELLQAHFLGEATHGAVFSIDAESGDLIAFKRLALDGLRAETLSEEVDAIGMLAMRFADRLGLELPQIAKAAQAQAAA